MNIDNIDNNNINQYNNRTITNTSNYYLLLNQYNLLNNYINYLNSSNNNINIINQQLNIIYNNMQYEYNNNYNYNNYNYNNNYNENNNYNNNENNNYNNNENNNYNENYNENNHDYYQPITQQSETSSAIQPINYTTNSIEYFRERSNENIENIIDRSIDVLQYSNIENPIDERCGITQEDFNQDDEVAVIKMCSHIFTRNNFVNWAKRHLTCPNCRYNLLLNTGYVKFSDIENISSNNLDNVFILTQQQLSQFISYR